MSENLLTHISLVEAVNFETDEALLTGESLPVQKECDSTFKEDTGPGDRLNIAYSSSTVTRGRARGVVVSTGMFTEIGSIALALRASGNKRRQVKRGPNGDIQDNDSADDSALNPRPNSEADRHGQNQHLSPTVLD